MGVELKIRYRAPTCLKNFHDCFCVHGEIDILTVKNFQEIDYTKEAANAELFASNFKKMDYVKVPTIYWEYTTPQVWLQRVLRSLLDEQFRCTQLSMLSNLAL